jgi:endonuclease I
MIKSTLFTLLTFITIGLNAQIPPNYYFFAEGQTGQQLRLALKVIIDDHDTQSYSSLWNHFLDTDQKDNGTVWDMYSDVPGGSPDYTFTFGSDQCGNYSGESDCYNREHSFPKSWFGGETPPMYTDLFHLVPTDGYVNSQRSNYPYGETDNPTWTSTNGSKRGPCSYPGYTGTIFEPIDAYKGDFARNYFYMLTRYMNLVDGWNSPMLSDDDFSDWALNLLLDWASQDTVSTKEIDRNNEIYLIQDNRNPFIDHPEYINEIWGFPASIKESKLQAPSAYYTSGSIQLLNLIASFSELKIFTVSGQLIYTIRVNGENEIIPIHLNNGLYILNFNGEKGQANVKLLAFNN